MKWRKPLFKYALIAVFVLGLSVFMIYGIRQIINTNTLSGNYFRSVPEFHNNEIRHWEIKSNREMKSFKHLRNKIIKHYDLDKKYYTDSDYVDCAIYGGRFVLIDKKYQKKVKKSDDYNFYATSMTAWGYEDFIKIDDPELKKPYEKLMGGAQN